MSEELQAERRVDRRILKTRKSIRDAFFKLASEQDYRRISISALAREANIDRKTFYLHYDSIDALVEEIIDEAIDELASDIYLFLTTPTKDNEEAERIFSEIFTEKRSNLDDLKLASPHVPTGHFMSLFERSLWKKFEEMDWGKLFGADSDSSLSPLKISFIIGGIIAGLRYWRKTETNIELPAFAREMRSMILKSCKELEGQDKF